MDGLDWTGLLTEIETATPVGKLTISFLFPKVEHIPSITFVRCTGKTSGEFVLPRHSRRSPVLCEHTILHYVLRGGWRDEIFYLLHSIQKRMRGSGMQSLA